jgi:hypothetical protein
VTCLWKWPCGASNRGDATATEIGDVAREVLLELREPDSEASAAARAAGLDPAGLVDARAEVTDGEHGAEPILTTILVGIAVSAGSKAAESLWKDVLWPRIRRRSALARSVRRNPRSGRADPMQAVSPYPGLEAWMWRSLLARAAVFYATRTRLFAVLRPRRQTAAPSSSCSAISSSARTGNGRPRTWDDRDRGHPGGRSVGRPR